MPHAAVDVGHFCAQQPSGAAPDDPNDIEFFRVFYSCADVPGIESRHDPGRPPYCR
jgi:hypothetical protein